MPAQPMTDQAFMIRSELSIKEGRLDDFVRVAGAIVEAVREIEPAMISFIQFMNEDRTRVTGIQLHPSVESFEYHLRMMKEKIQIASDAIALERVVAYGPTNPAIDAYLDTMRKMDVEVQTWPHPFNGFTRFALPDSLEARVREDER